MNWSAWIDAYSPAKIQGGHKCMPASSFHYGTPWLFISRPAQLDGCGEREKRVGKARADRCKSIV